MLWLQGWRAAYRAWRYRLHDERAEVAFLLRSLRPGQTAVDVGAHKGAFTWWMQRAVTRRGRVLAIEPQPELAAALERLQRRRWPHVQVVAGALSASSGSLTLHRPGGRPSPGATLETPGEPGGQQITVPVETLDGLLDRTAARPVHFLKCDVEGHELEVLRGAERTLRSDRPILLFECEQRHLRRGSVGAVFDFLEGLGYRGAFFQGPRMRPLDDFHPGMQADPQSPDYVNNFAFAPAARARELRRAA